MLHLNLCANQGAVGGGEVMLLAIAQAARSLGHEVTIIAPEQPCEVAREAAALGFSTVALPGDSTAGYMRGLRRWDARERTGILGATGCGPPWPRPVTDAASFIFTRSPTESNVS